MREHFRKKGDTHVHEYERGQGSPAVSPPGEYKAPPDVRPKEPSPGIFSRLNAKIAKAKEERDAISKKERDEKALDKEIQAAQRAKERKIAEEEAVAKKRQADLEKIRTQEVARATARANRPSLRSRALTLAKAGYAAYQKNQKKPRRSRKTARRSSRKNARRV